jgi:hypothetical protein
MDDDPPFVDKDDAEALTVSEQMFGLQDQLYQSAPLKLTKK